jgi:hypothetical protein
LFFGCWRKILLHNFLCTWPLHAREETLWGCPFSQRGSLDCPWAQLGYLLCLNS